MDKTQRVIELLTKEFAEEIKKALQQQNKKASGTLINSISSNFVKKSEKEFWGEVWGSSYFKFVDKGRAAGSYPPLKPLIEWCKLKGFTEASAIPLQKKIFRFGIEPAEILSKLKLLVMQKRLPEIEKAAAADVAAEIQKIIEEEKINKQG